VPPPPEQPEEEEAPSFYVDDKNLSAAEVEDSWEEEPSIAEPEVAEPTFEVSEGIDSIIVDIEDQEPVAEEPVVTESMPPPVADVPPPMRRPVMFGVGDPFSDGDLEVIAPEVLPESVSMEPIKSRIDFAAQGNQLHLQLRGSGAIAEMGQVRALDIEVPVPGQWIGNQKVTLQLRLTLTPAEDEND
jgi:hypothetical protein